MSAHRSRKICWTPSDCKEAEKFLLSCVLISSDIETIPFRKKNKSKIFVMTIACYTGITNSGKIRSFCFPFQQGKSASSGAPTHIEWIFRTCEKVNASGIRFTGQNFTYDLAWFMRYGIPVANWAYDTMIMFWSRWPELPKTLDFIASILLDDYQYWKAGRKSDDFLEYCDYGMSDTESTLLCTLKMIPWLLDDSQIRKNFFKAHTRCIAGLSMSMKGMRVNPETMEKFRVDLTNIADEKLKQLRYIVADSEFNPNSAPQKKELIYGLLGARLRNAKGRFVSKDSDASTGAFVLRAIRSEHPIFRRVANGILDAIKPAKQLSNVVGLAFIRSEARPESPPRFITSYDGVGTTTTRYSSRGSAFGHGGNAQNIRKDYRSFAVADDDSFILEVDLSASDDVFVSFESQEPKKIELVRSGRDIHASNALIFFPSWTYEGIVAGKKAKDPKVVDPITGIRQITKKVVHGNHYLMAGLTLLMSAGREAIVAAAKELGFEQAGTWPQEQLAKFCGLLEEKFRTHYPRFKRAGPGSWYEELKTEVIETGGFTSVFDYFQRFISNPHDDSTLRAIAATAGQANTAGRINMAIDELVLGIRTYEFRDGVAPDADDPVRVCSESLNGCSLRMQTHDSLTYNVNYRHPRWADGVDNILRVMKRPIVCKGEEFSVGIEADIGFAWADKNGIEIKSVEDIEAWLIQQGK